MEPNIERRVVINKTVESETKNINIQTISTIVVDGIEGPMQIHREVLCPGADLSDEGRAASNLAPLDDETRAIAALLWDEKATSAYTEKFVAAQASAAAEQQAAADAVAAQQQQAQQALAEQQRQAEQDLADRVGRLQAREQALADALAKLQLTANALAEVHAAIRGL